MTDQTTDQASSSAVWGLDVGGAHLKAASSRGDARTFSFPLWKQPSQLSERLGALLEDARVDRLVVTMTAELCDCFKDKEEGVATVLDGIAKAFPKVPIKIWHTGGRFVSDAEARANPWGVAASNWLALATWVGKKFPCDAALLVDIGSTTTDLIPLRDGTPVPTGRCDPDRLASGELVYTGVSRTPLCALLSRVELGGVSYRTMAEHFATTLDAYVWLGDLPEAPELTETADGTGATRSFAQRRLARMIGSDPTRFGEDDTTTLAKAARQAQLTLLESAVRQVAEASLPDAVDRVIVSGQGEFLARRLRDRCPRLGRSETISLASRLGENVSQAACAYALAQLALIC
ncbi:Hydantoinase/oxoprolinase [Planctomycetes bacterium Pan216]|uniref:Hydantoinase/oxoprolinase n=1 Tax=Kolteria novifilia TaxID=2527975 RepID=A0A518BB11_9BACT|nr:Hydantoinase/oxoprolinase [Planctomycetes bacterium Pan216]